MGGSESRDAGSGRPDNENGKHDGVAKAVGAAAGLVLLGWGASKLASGSEEKQTEETKMMKAPGRDGHIPRKDFEENPQGYFSELHKEKKTNK